MLLLGIIVTGTHQARRTGNSGTNGSPKKIASAVQAAVKALVAFPLLVRRLDSCNDAAATLEVYCMQVSAKPCVR